jgi:hypothetical protein
MGLKEVRIKRGLPPTIDDDDIILNQQWMANHQQSQMMDQQNQSQQFVDDDGEEGADDFWNNLIDTEGADEVVKGLLHEHRANPMMRDAFLQLQKALKNEPIEA